MLKHAIPVKATLLNDNIFKPSTQYLLGEIKYIFKLIYVIRHMLHDIIHPTQVH